MELRTESQGVGPGLGSRRPKTFAQQFAARINPHVPNHGACNILESSSFLSDSRRAATLFKRAMCSCPGLPAKISSLRPFARFRFISIYVFGNCAAAQREGLRDESTLIKKLELSMHEPDCCAGVFLISMSGMVVALAVKAIKIPFIGLERLPKQQVCTF